MAKRELVPAALHSELTEYSSLIRALRTNHTLDISSHIIKPPPVHARPQDDECFSSNNDSSEDEEEDLHPTHDHNNYRDKSESLGSTSQSCDISLSHSDTSSSDDSSSQSNQKRKRPLSPSRPRKRDTWTRWPLLIGDLHVPEWSLEDEMAVLAATALKLNPHPPLPAVESPDLVDNSENNEHEDSDTDNDYLPHITNVASNYLSTILALVITHTPNRPNAQQNRIEPMGWRNVLDILASCGDPNIADQRIINSVIARMEALLGVSEDTKSTRSLAAHRIQYSIDAKEKLKTQLSYSMDSLLSLASPPVETRPPP